MRSKFFWLSATFVLALAGCGGDAPAGIQLKINEERTGLIWDAVEGAVNYEIDVDGVKDLKVNPGYDFSTTVGNHKVTITAIDANGGRGLTGSFNFETKESALGDLSLADSKITWSSALTCGLEYKVDNGEYKPVTGTYIDATEEGLYTVLAPKKIGDDHVFYNKKVERFIIVTNDAQEEYILEDASAPDDASLSETYTKTKYGNNGWVEASSDVSLDKTSEAYVTGNAANFKFWRQDVYYKFSKAISLPGAFNELSFSMKSEDAVDAYIAFEVGHTMVVGNMDLNGVYITYHIAEAPTKWTHYRVTMDDPGWVITFNGMKLPFSQIKEIVKGYGFYVNKLADFLPYFDTYQIRLKGVHDENWSTCRAYFDDIKLVNSDLKQSVITEIQPRLFLADSYAFRSDLIAAGSIQIDGNNGEFNVPALSISIPVTIARPDEYTATVTCTESGKDFVATFSSPDGGASLKLESVTGTLAPAFAGIQVEAVSKLDDYEDYDGTGKGLDKTNIDPDATSGLRKAYYSDWFDNNSTDNPRSVVADSNWAMMGSTDYLLLKDDDAHTGKKSMSIKAGGNPCRFMNDELRTGTGKAYKGRYLSMWMKNVLTGTATVIICAYSTNKLDASNHVSDAIRTTMTFTAQPSDTEWREVKLELDPNKYYYGFSILAKEGPSPAGRILVDDVYIYGDLSPWGN